MKILIVNKFLHPNGGSETYVFGLGDILKSNGHDVQFFGMDSTKRCVGNGANAYTTNMDFHSSDFVSKLTYPLKTIYSKEARKKIRLVLDDFKPDIVHINNFNYQLTPSIILEIVKWRNSGKRKCNIIYTAHDYQLICPNHTLYNQTLNSSCEKCIDGKYFNCVKYKCIHNSILRSILGCIESYFWKKKGVYKYIDRIICPSYFMKKELDKYSLFKEKTVVLHNFIDKSQKNNRVFKKNYIIYFGRYSKEKGINTLVEACKLYPNLNFVFAGSGPLEHIIDKVDNINNVGFKSGDALWKLVGEAMFSIYPSEWYENCPYSVMESQIYGTPVLAANIGGIPELIDINKTGILFESGDLKDLTKKIEKMLENNNYETFSQNCILKSFLTSNDYYEQLIELYRTI